MKKIFLLTTLLSSLLLTGCDLFKEQEPEKEQEQEKTLYTFTFIGEHCSMEHQDSYEEGSKVTLTLVIDPDYELNEDIEVIGCNDYTFDYDTNILEAVITNNTTVVANCTEIHYIDYIMGLNGNIYGSNFTSTLTEDFENNSFTNTTILNVDDEEIILTKTKKFNDNFNIIEETLDLESTNYNSSDKTVYEYCDESNIEPKIVSFYELKDGEYVLSSKEITTFYDETTKYKGFVKEKITYNSKNEEVNKIVHEFGDDFIYKESEYLPKDGKWHIEESTTYYSEEDKEQGTIKEYAVIAQYWDTFSEVSSELISETILYEKIYDKDGKLLSEIDKFNKKTTYTYNESGDPTKESIYLRGSQPEEWLKDGEVEYIYENDLLKELNYYKFSDDKTINLDEKWEFTHNEFNILTSIKMTKLDDKLKLSTINFVIDRRNSREKYIGTFDFGFTKGNYLTHTGFEEFFDNFMAIY